MTFTQNRAEARIAGQVSDDFPGQSRMSGGDNETDVTEFAAIPTGPSGVCAATTVTPVGRWPRTQRKRLWSKPVASHLNAEST
jgi:hypothetical protein